ncbi:MAG TPA: hypothetical protein VNA15_09030, partial [Candidatus Angelobacter sp.]|nr:hypothetical protein [Candidatus Angelobacter sp.]
MDAASATRLIIILSLSYGLAVFPMNPGSVRLQGAVNRIQLLSPPLLFPPQPQWVPSGAMVDKLQIQVYTDEIAEYNAMLATPSQLDLGDFPLPKSLVGTFFADTRFTLSSPTAGFDMFDIEFNHANTFFGISDNHGNSLAGIEFRQAIAHLIDKQSFISAVLGGLGIPMDNAVPPAQRLLHPGLLCGSDSPSTGCTGSYTANYTTNGVKGSYSLSGPCGWDTLFPTGCISAFHNAADTVDAFGIVTASASNLDFCDAAQHLVAAGLANGVNAADCSVAGHQLAGLSGGSIIFVVRSDNPPRQKLGTALAARMCELFNGAGTTSCTQVSIFLQPSFGQIENTGSVQLGWHMYTGGLRFASEFDQLYSFYNSQFASSACGGRPVSFGNNYFYYCRSDYDHFSRMLEFNDTLSGAIASAQVAMQIFGRTVASIPIWSSLIRIPYSAGWTGVNNADGEGPVNYFASLNAWSSSPSLFGTLRWGF